MGMKQVFSVASAAFVAFSLSVTANGGETIEQTADDASSSVSSLTNWDASGKKLGTPLPENDYVSEKKLRAPTSGNVNFNGKSLSLGKVGGSANPSFVPYGGTYTFLNDGLFLNKGFFQWYSSDKASTIAGTVTLQAPASDPYRFMFAQNTSTINDQLTITATLKGAAGTAMSFYHNQDVESGNGKVVLYPKDASEFKGEIILDSASKVKRAISLELEGAKTFGGKITLGKYCKILPQYASTLWTIGSLSFAANSTLETKLTINGNTGKPETSTITLTEGLTTTDPVNLTFTGGARKDTDAAVGYEWSVLKLPKAKAEQIHPEHFVLASQNTSFPKDDFYVGLIVRTNENDVSLNVISRKRVYMTETLDAGNRGFGCDPYYEYYTAATNAAAWSDGKTLGSPDVDYVSGSHLNLAPPSLCDANHAYVFPGASLTMSNSMTLCTAARQVTFPVLRMMRGSQFWPLTDEMTETTVVRGQIYLVNSSTRYPAYVRVRTGMSVDVQADLSGASGCCLQIQPNADNATGCRIAFGHDNSDYKGSIFVAGNSDGVSDFANGQTLVLQAANNVGGSLTSFSADALSLFRFATLEVTNDLVFATANRGLTVNNARIKVGASATFTFANDITYAGPLVKTGAGRLVLGGSALGSKKTLTVAEGTLAISTDTALDGVVVTFTGGALAVDPATTGEYGVKGPLSGNLPVAFDLPADEETHEYADVAVCTVDASADVTPKAVRIPRHRVVFHWRDNNNGTKTLLADISRTGCAIILR